MTFKDKVAVWWKKLKEKYHLSVVNKDLFVEVYSFQFSKAGFYGVILGLVFLISIITFTIIATTPLKRFVPGYESDDVHRKLIHLYKKVTLLEEEVDGKADYAMINDSILRNVGINPDSINWDEFEVFEKPKVVHKTLPEFYLHEAKKSLNLNLYYFFHPVKGKIVRGYAPLKGRYGVDLVCDLNETVKSILSGRVIVAVWTADNGHVIMIKHSNDMLSVYKGNSVLFKKEGDMVKAGEVIGVVGNNANATSKANLYFEIWHQQASLNPEELIQFNN